MYEEFSFSLVFFVLLTLDVMRLWLARLGGISKSVYCGWGADRGICFMSEYVNRRCTTVETFDVEIYFWITDAL